MDPYYSMNLSQGRNCNQAMNNNCRQNNQNYRRPQPCGNRPSCGSCKDNFYQTNPSMNRMSDGKPGHVMTVECECKAIPRTCHKEDKMEQLGSCFPLAMSYVPWQQWGELYDADCALMQGTLFKDLDLKFCGVRC